MLVKTVILIKMDWDNKEKQIPHTQIIQIVNQVIGLSKNSCHLFMPYRMYKRVILWRLKVRLGKLNHNIRPLPFFLISSGNA